eukprot:m.215874 g.215874  ORF g.215874 m.215874 type:complete len:55 (-) comp18646_c0_seq8:134-298(-)
MRRAFNMLSHVLQAQEQRVMDDALLVTKQTNNTAAAALAGTATPIDISESKDSN